MPAKAPCAIAALALAAFSVFARGGPAAEPVPSPFLEDFEAYTADQPAPPPWIDIAFRVDGTSVPAPSILVVDTTGPDGLPTRAYRNINAVGDNSGAYAPFAEARYHRLSTDVRIDQFTNNPAPHFGWPSAIGFTHDTGQPDIDADPQVLVYAWLDRQWYLFLGGVGMPSRNLRIITPPIVEGEWVRVSIQLDTLTGRTDAWIDDADGNRLGQRSTTPTPWETEVGEFDGIVLFDGEGGVGQPGFVPGDQSGIATYDNLRYDRLPDCPADTAAPLGVIDFSDVLAFLSAFGAGEPLADVATPLGVHDFSDIVAFLAYFNAACPG